jgi:ABC-type multidrug transport system fused ATPase/permease subunit
MDRVAVMENGRIVEIGRPEDLLASDTKLRALAELQRIPVAAGATS